MKLYLNHLEIKKTSELLQNQICGSTIDRVIIPERDFTSKGFYTHEWVLRLKSKNPQQKISALLYSTQNAHPYISAYTGKGPKSSEKASLSVFLQGIQKILKGLKITAYYSLKYERITYLECRDVQINKNYILITELIPAHPNCFLVEKTGEELKILLQERGDQSHYQPPPEKTQTQKYEIREELLSSLENYTQIIETELQKTESEKKTKDLLKIFTQKKNYLEKNIQKTKKSIELTQKEPPWGTYGHLLKSQLHDLKKPENKQRSVFDFSLEKDVFIPSLPHKSPQEEIQIFFQKEKRNKRKLIELNEQLLEHEEELNKLISLNIPPQGSDFPLQKLKELEKIFFPENNRALKKSNTESEIGKSFMSQEGLEIIVGRKKEENLKITFQIAKGNDLWLHARGKPSAHAVILLRNKKSASLETLLDAAQLLIHYSKGASWGKTEIDYTFRKYVKKIKNSDQVSYTQNKTILVELDQERLQRLLKGY